MDLDVCASRSTRRASSSSLDEKLTGSRLRALECAEACSMSRGSRPSLVPRSHCSHDRHLYTDKSCCSYIVHHEPIPLRTLDATAQNGRVSGARLNKQSQHDQSKRGKHCKGQSPTAGTHVWFPRPPSSVIAAHRITSPPVAGPGYRCPHVQQ